MNSSSSNYNYLFPFEINYNLNKLDSWMERNWTLSLYLGTTYVLLIFYGQSRMRNRTAYQLRFPLMIWSTLLSVFSLLGTLRWTPEVLKVYHQHGMHGIICSRSYIEDDVVVIWGWFFIYSKVFELIDTAFIVLRKQELILLHWYHHFATMVYCWCTFTGYPSIARPFIIMNYSVHTVMYFYYALRALRIRSPRWVSMFITTVQILQMFAGVTVTIYAAMLKLNGRQCETPNETVALGTLLYLSFAVLFVKFFISNYFGKGKMSLDAKKSK